MGVKGTRLFALLMVFVVVLGTVSISGCTQSSGGADWLKLVPEDAVVAGVFDASTLSDLKDLMKETPYEEGKSVYDAYVEMRSDLKEDLGIDPEDVSRVVFSVTSIPKSDYESPKVAVYVEGNFDTSEIKKKVENLTSESEVKRTTYKDATIYYDDEFSMAIGKDYVVMGSSLTLVEDIIDLKNGKGKWAEKYKDVVDKVGSGNLVLVYDVDYLTGHLGDIKPSSSEEAQILSVIGKVDYGSFKLKISGDEYTVKTVLKAVDEASAKNIVKNADALLTLANTTLSLGQLGDMNPREKALVEKLRGIIGKIKIKADGKYVVQELTVTKKEIEDVLEVATGYGGYTSTQRAEANQIAQEAQKRIQEQLNNMTIEG
ncbi:hypothetical protein A3L09_00520 [Thermococcus profundus]|uniref:Uncharacterized protein n=1 Tax=Thermococcus profundus TaxID=49899 RepID=A0A2Z2MIR3_THEPR|nr:hypothetical protein [Thermococcus profundus]ASJ01848.1 hypothetical protein A3L09_00520 [Thermococcus profundus]